MMEQNFLQVAEKIMKSSSGTCEIQVSPIFHENFLKALFNLFIELKLILIQRNPFCVVSGQLYAILRREVNTNQRIYFDIDSSDQYVVSGGTDGILRIWDIKSPIGDQGKCFYYFLSRVSNLKLR